MPKTPPKRSPAKQKAKARKVKAHKHAEAVAARKQAARKRRFTINWNGCPRLPVTRVALRLAILAVQRHVKACYITATTNGVHASGSYHYQQRAFDLGSDSPDNEPEKKAQQFLLDKYGAGHFVELFGPLPFYVKDGVLYRGSVFPGHGDHTHVAI